MTSRRTRALLACIRDARAAELMRELLGERESEQQRIAELKREVRELRQILRKLCIVTHLSPHEID